VKQTKKQLLEQNIRAAHKWDHCKVLMNALQMKLAPKPTLIIVASSKVLIQVEHDD
jgi:hypothetical protein